eukprot:CAMPEP_0185903450 /NCGR_PEP_ID=MMETSP0196C-20130402/2688_1 /TAXON_ID=2932 /ORGANISM="Alexandrium fundyense, Strain CCMP1719" /LENGTH=52 /DNA_ID=CAMNT_0028622499 /DNA_START=1 /DNA_END=156 /DNA_ORIENTATION=-
MEPWNIVTKKCSAAWNTAEDSKSGLPLKSKSMAIHRVLKTTRPKVAYSKAEL